jgi:hypothetical protein
MHYHCILASGRSVLASKQSNTIERMQAPYQFDWRRNTYEALIRVLRMYGRQNEYPNLLCI